jgi:hypothetical protein
MADCTFVFIYDAVIGFTFTAGLALGILIGWFEWGRQKAAA